MMITIVNITSMMKILEAFQMLCHFLVTKLREYLLVTSS